MRDNRVIDPIFQMCSERSGSNLMTKIFDAHPEVVAPSPAHLFRIFSDLAWKYNDGSASLQQDLLDMFDAKVGTWLIDDCSRLHREAIVKDSKSAAYMIAALLNAECSSAGK